MQTTENIELFRFIVTDGAGTTEHCYAGAGAGPETVTLTINGADLKFIPARFSSPELHKEEIEFSIPSDNPIAVFQLPQPTPILCVIYHAHTDENETRALVVWTGTVAAIGPDGSSAKVRCESFNARLRRRPFLNV
jgi:hypothetical protein